MTDPTLIDVRDDDKYQAKHIKGAHHFSHEKILAGENPNLAKNAPITLYCSSGNKAARMKAELTQRGFINVTSSSLDVLEEAGHDTESNLPKKSLSSK